MEEIQAAADGAISPEQAAKLRQCPAHIDNLEAHRKEIEQEISAIALSKSNATEAELHLLSAENIIAEVKGTDNDYAKTVYLYLNNLYARWQKPEQALAYKNLYIECSCHHQ